MKTSASIETDLKRRGVGVAREDVWLAAGLAAVTLAVALYFAPRGFHAGFVDLGHDGYQLRQVLDLLSGGVIFRDTFDQYGPLNGYLNAVGFVALGRRLLAMKYFIGGCYALSAIAIFVIARHWLNRGLAAFSVLVWVGLAPFYNHGIMISPHAYALLFQAVATMIALRTPDLAPRRFALIGLLAGLSWAVKQAMGVLYLAAILCWLLAIVTLRRHHWRRAAGATMAVSIAFFGVVVSFLLLLWMKGALRDWYLQTVVFPHHFYVAGSAPGDLRSLFGTLISFVQLQFTQPLYWITIRVVPLATALVQIRRQRPRDDLLLMASITAFLWLGAYPSVNFMHQWWTASLAIPPFVVCVRGVLRRWTLSDRTVSAMAAAAVTLIVATGVVERANATVTRARTLTETLREPYAFRGIRTDLQTRRAFETLYGTVAAFRMGRPDARVVSIESADGWGNGMVETLPLLSFLENNRHFHPVYWNLPVLSNVVYADYPERLWQYVRQDRPLIVDHRSGAYNPVRICAYALLVSERSDRGHWYVYAPGGSAPTYAPATIDPSIDESMEYGCAEDGTGPTLPTPRIAVDGAWRGSTMPSTVRDGRVEFPSEHPLELDDPALADAAGPVNVYTWPADLPRATVRGRIEPVSTDVVWRAGKGDIVREFRAGAWTVDGQVKLPFSYLLQWAEKPVQAGARLVVRGEVFEGGLQVGFLERNRWVGSVCVSHPGPFEAVLVVPATRRYSLVAANCIMSNRSERRQSGPVRAALALLVGDVYRNRLMVSDAGWLSDIDESSTARDTGHAGRSSSPQ